MLLRKLNNEKDTYSIRDLQKKEAEKQITRTNCGKKWKEEQ